MARRLVWGIIIFLSHTLYSSEDVTLSLPEVDQESQPQYPGGPAKSSSSESGIVNKSLEDYSASKFATERLYQLNDAMYLVGLTDEKGNSLYEINLPLFKNVLDRMPISKFNQMFLDLKAIRSGRRNSDAKANNIEFMQKIIEYLNDTKDKSQKGGGVVLEGEYNFQVQFFENKIKKLAKKADQRLKWTILSTSSLSLFILVTIVLSYLVADCRAGM
jgi:hypothetical protein